MAYNYFVNEGSDVNLIKSLTGDANAGSFVKATCAAVLATNDLHHIHFHIKGKQFDRIHNLANEYYDRLSDECDTLAELSIEYEHRCPNFSKANEFLPEWRPLETEVFTYEDAIQLIDSIINDYVMYLNNLRESTTENDVQSLLDDTIRYWKKEINYKNKQRM